MKNLEVAGVDVLLLGRRRLLVEVGDFEALRGAFVLSGAARGACEWVWRLRKVADCGARPPWSQPRGKSMGLSVNSHTNATRIGWHLWEIDIRFAPGLPPGWLVPDHAACLAPPPH